MSTDLKLKVKPGSNFGEISMTGFSRELLASIPISNDGYIDPVDLSRALLATVVFADESAQAASDNETPVKELDLMKLIFDSSIAVEGRVN